MVPLHLGIYHLFFENLKRRMRQLLYLNNHSDFFVQLFWCFGSVPGWIRTELGAEMASKKDKKKMKKYQI
jgi:hypothetical protein